MLLYAVVGLPAASNGKASCSRVALSVSKMTPPELVMDLGANQKPMRFTVARLRHMTRSTVNVMDRTAKRTRRFEGVDITWLVLAKHQSYGDRTQVTVKTLREEGVVSGER